MTSPPSPPQLLQERCTEGQSLLSSVLTSRDKVIPWGAPQIEDRALDTAQRDWGAFQRRLEETRAHLSSTLARLRQIGQRFQSLSQWLEEMERRANLRSHRRSSRSTKEAQLKQLQVRGGDRWSVVGCDTHISPLGTVVASLCTLSECLFCRRNAVKSLRLMRG